MASLVGRVLDREAIENRKCYLQLFFCQRAARFAEWWSEDLRPAEREAFLEECGVPRAATPAGERRATFPPGFTVEGLLERTPIDDPTGEPQLFAPFDGALRPFRRRPGPASRPVVVDGPRRPQVRSLSSRTRSRSGRRA